MRALLEWQEDWMKVAGLEEVRTFNVTSLGNCYTL